MSYWLRCVRTGAAALGGLACAVSGLLVCSALAAATAHALTIEMDDVAPDRVERQRAFAEGALPLPDTPNLAQFAERLQAKGLKVGDHVFIRIFKSESQLEVWMRKDASYVLFATYPICSWSGTLGPKQKEGDKQNPEGFYSISRRQLQWSGRWPRALDLGYPNTFDRAHKRTGSYLLVHGGCSSVGCYAMTNAVMAEIFELTEQALKKGQPQVEVHVFPFRMTDANLQRYAASPWVDFWGMLRAGYDSFERTRVPPRIGICDKQYMVEMVEAGQADVVLASRVVKGVWRRSRRAELPKICKPVNAMSVASVGKADADMGDVSAPSAAVSLGGVAAFEDPNTEAEALAETPATATPATKDGAIASSAPKADEVEDATAATSRVYKASAAVKQVSASAAAKTSVSRAAARLRAAASRAGGPVKRRIRAPEHVEARREAGSSTQRRRRAAARRSASGRESTGSNVHEVFRETLSVP